MKFLLCFALFCALATAKPTDGVNKLEESSASQIIKNETVLSNNHRVERDDQLSPLVQMSAESEQKKLKTGSNVDPNSSDDNPRNSYSSTINQNNPPVYSSQLTSMLNTDSSLPTRSASEYSRPIISTYPSVSYGSHASYGLGSYGSLESPGVASYSYPSSAFNGLGSGSYGYSGSNGYLGSYGYSGSNGYLGSYGYPGSNIYSGSNGLSQVYMPQSYGSSGSLQSYGSLPLSVVSAPCSNSVPYHGGISIAQQIIHKPMITELQEVIHKPIITEVQEIVNKPIMSEFQQVIHKPLYTEHIGLGPSYHGYQKHIVKQPFYQTPTKQFVHQPLSHSGTIHLADKYEQAVNTHSICESGSGSSYGFSGASLPAVYGSGIGVVQPSGLYGSAISLSHPASYGQVYSSGTPVATHYSSLVQDSAPCGYDTIPSVQTSYKSAIPASIGTETSNVIGYPASPSNGYSLGSSNGNSYGRQATILNTSNGESYRNTEENAPPKAAEQITYDEFVPYKQQPNANQQYNDNQFQQQRSRSDEDTKTFKMDVDAIAKQIEKNPDMRKQLIKIITESIYVGDQMTPANKKQKDQTNQSFPQIKID